MERRVTHSLVNALRDVPSFASVDDRMLLALIGDSANLYWPPGSVVFERGSPADGLYIVISGRVRVVGENGATLAALGPGDFFGEISLVGPGPRTATVTAETDTKLLLLGPQRFRVVVDHEPAIAYSIMEKMGERLRASERAISH